MAGVRGEPEGPTALGLGGDEVVGVVADADVTGGGGVGADSVGVDRGKGGGPAQGVEGVTEISESRN